MKRPRILLVDDHDMFRNGLSLVLGLGIAEADILEAASCEAALLDGPDHLDLILLDINLGGLGGLEGIGCCKARWPWALVFMLSAEDDAKTVDRALALGADGFLSKADKAETIIARVRQAIGCAARGEAPLADKSPPSLTSAQQEILALLRQGLSNKQISQQLGLPDNTVRRHLQEILAFFRVDSRDEAISAARRQDLIH